MSSFKFIVLQADGSALPPAATGSLTVSDNGNNTSTIKIKGFTGIASGSFTTNTASASGFTIMNGVSNSDPDGFVSGFTASILCAKCDSKNIAGEITFSNNGNSQSGLLLGADGN